MPRRRRSGGSLGDRNVGRPAEGPLGYGVMHVLSKQLRAQIFAILCKRIASPKEIADELGEGLSQVSYHVRILLSHNLIALDHTVQRDGTVERFYRAIPEFFEEAPDTSGAERFDRRHR